MNCASSAARQRRRRRRHPSVLAAPWQHSLAAWRSTSSERWITTIAVENCTSVRQDSELRQSEGRTLLNDRTTRPLFTALDLSKVRSCRSQHATKMCLHMIDCYLFSPVYIDDKIDILNSCAFCHSSSLSVENLIAQRCALCIRWLVVLRLVLIGPQTGADRPTEQPDTSHQWETLVIKAFIGRHAVTWLGRLRGWTLQSSKNM